MDVVLQLIKLAGDQVSEEIWYRVIQIITNQGDDLQKYATEVVWKSLVAEKFPHRTLVKVAGYVLGEFGHMIAEAPESNAQRQFDVLSGLFGQSEPEVRALLLNTFVKLAHSYAEIVPQVPATPPPQRQTPPAPLFPQPPPLPHPPSTALPRAPP